MLLLLSVLVLVLVLRLVLVLVLRLVLVLVLRLVLVLVLLLVPVLVLPCSCCCSCVFLPSEEAWILCRRARQARRNRPCDDIACIHPCASAYSFNGNSCATQLPLKKVYE